MRFTQAPREDCDKTVARLRTADAIRSRNATTARRRADQNDKAEVTCVCHDVRESVDLGSSDESRVARNSP